MQIRRFMALVAAWLLAWAANAQPARPLDVAAAQARALSHIVSFAARTLHGPEHSYRVRDVVMDADGATHVRFDRRYKGLDVIGGDLVMHATGRGQFNGASLTLTRWIDLPLKPAIAPRHAVELALGRHPGDTRNTPPVLLVYARADLPTLAWGVRVFGEQPDGTPSEKHVMVDAYGGQVLEAWDDIHTGAVSGTGKGFFNGEVALTTDSVSAGYELRDPDRGGQYTLNMANKTAGGAIFKDADNVWGNFTLGDVATVGVDAQYGTAVTWDYYKNVHGRSGIANDGKGAYNRVHYGRRYNNAFWSDSCFCMTYGDGDGTTFNPFDSLDVAGHEMTHGVTSRTAGLVYSGESGGLNEATSDIFGAMVEFYAANPNDPGDYLIGEKLYRTGGGTRALRYMQQPSKDGASADCWYSGVGNLNVHYSSGVANHFFYLLAEGTTSGSPSPTCASGNTRVATGQGSVTPIGRSKAEKIWYRALTVYMTSSTNYAGARSATLKAASDLHGGNASDEYKAVAAAWSAVGLN